MRLMLLGPQRHNPVVRRALDHMEIDGKVAVITAGWQEREQHDQDLREEIGAQVVNLRIYERAQEVFARSPQLFAAHRRKQDALKFLQRVYSVRLEAAMSAVERLDELGQDEWGLMPGQRQAAMAQVRAMDQEHNAQVGALWRAFHEEHSLEHDPALREQREQLTQELEGCQALLIAGGHVAILLNRLMLFAPGPWLLDRPLVAWSAGAMALSSQIVLFHDRAAQGPNHPEVIGPGLGCYEGLIALPHAATRLRYDDRPRMSQLVQRFWPEVCAPLESQMWLERDARGQWRSRAGARLDLDGKLTLWPNPDTEAP